MLEEIEFHRLAKLRLEVDEPEELYVLVSFISFFLHIIILAEIRTAGCFPMKNPMIVSPRKQNAPCSLSIASNITRLLQTIQWSRRLVKLLLFLFDV